VKPGMITIGLAVVLLCACTLTQPETALQRLVQTPALAAPTAPVESTASPSATPDLAYVGQPFQDERAVFSGVCFNYWVQQVNRIYFVRTAFEHIDFYDEVDQSGACRFPVVRNPFDFEQGRMLMGAVNVGTGCWAYTDPIEMVTDDEAKTIIMRVGWAVAGDCDYRLARPFWVSIARPPDDYQIAFEFVPLE
jgi:hypothetical protein